MNPKVFRPLPWIKAVMHSDLTQVQKLVAVTLVGYANPNGTNAHPGRQGIADALGISISTVKRATKVLSADHWIEKTSHGREAVPRNYADVYRLLVRVDHGSKASDHGSRVTDQGSQACTPNCSSTPAPSHLSDSDESGRASAPPRSFQRRGRPENSNDEEEERLWEQLGHVRLDEEVSVDAQLAKGRHPKAIRNAIFNQRREDLPTTHPDWLATGGRASVLDQWLGFRLGVLSVDESLSAARQRIGGENPDAIFNAIRQRRIDRAFSSAAEDSQ